MIIKNFDTEKIYKNLPIIKNKYTWRDFKVGDIVWYFTSRLNSSSGAWLQKTGKHHGYVLVQGKIYEDNDDGGKYIKILDSFQKKWETPIEKERSNQAVDYQYYGSKFDYVVERVVFVKEKAKEIKNDINKKVDITN